MYQPRPFKIDDLARLHAFMQRNPLCLMIVSVADQTHANPVPVLLDTEIAPQGRLRFHLARGNPLTGWLDGERPALLVFSGEDHYISPDWYHTEQMVPTWNYAMVQARGIAQPLDDTGLSQLLDDLSAEHEEPLKPKPPWTTAKLDGPIYARMRKGICGFEMPIDSLQGKWKMSQNRGIDDRQGVIDALETLADNPAASQVAKTLRRLDNQD